MAPLRFGTDGVRGRAFDELSVDLAFSIGEAAATVLAADHAVIGRDTRESGPALSDALAAGLRAGGVQPLDLTVAPTPAVAHVAAERGAIGAMISASHNPWFDNGIKLFSPSGTKLSDGEQNAIEQWIDQDPVDQPGSTDATHAHDPIESIQTELVSWVQSVKSSVDVDLSDLNVVVDAANGAASHVAGPVLADLGAQVTLMSASPDGRNINQDCGSTDPGALAAEVVRLGADLGVAFDGDADRLVCVDNRGRIVDGDQLMAVIAKDMQADGRLRQNTVVVTVMSNLGFHRAMEQAGLNVHVTPVGDRHILDALKRNRWSFGGEQSGHLIFGDIAATGDGLLSAVQALSVMTKSNQGLAELADAAMVRFPQVLRNVAVADRLSDIDAVFAADEALAGKIRDAERHLGSDGRVLIRASGTEPVVRVMVEAADRALADQVCGDLCDLVSERLGS